MGMAFKQVVQFRDHFFVRSRRRWHRLEEPIGSNGFNIHLWRTPDDCPARSAARGTLYEPSPWIDTTANTLGLTFTLGPRGQLIRSSRERLVQ